MATERQIAANRRNASKSTGPKTSAGKHCASANSYRHGLSVRTDDEDNFDDIEWLVRNIAGETTNEHLLQCARIAARAHLDLVRVRQLKVDFINRVIKFGVPEYIPFSIRSVEAELRYLKRQPFNQLGEFEWPKWADPLDATSGQEECAAEVVRRLLPELRKLDRYEARAHALKASALREVSLRVSRNKVKC
jgi:hypothetical protein